MSDTLEGPGPEEIKAVSDLWDKIQKAVEKEQKNLILTRADLYALEKIWSRQAAYIGALEETVRELEAELKEANEQLSTRRRIWRPNS